MLHTGENGRAPASFNAQCAQAVATNTITDKLREKAAKLLIKELLQTPDATITIDATTFTYAALADNLKAKGSAYTTQTELYIAIADVLHRADTQAPVDTTLLQVITHPIYLKNFLEKVFNRHLSSQNSSKTS